MEKKGVDILIGQLSRLADNMVDSLTPAGLSALRSELSKEEHAVQDV